MAAAARASTPLCCLSSLPAGNAGTRLEAPVLAAHGCCSQANFATLCAPTARVLRKAVRTAGVPILSSSRAGLRPLRRALSGRHGPPSRCREGLRVRAMDASLGGDAAREPSPVFSRIGVRDPYKRLGIGRDASTEEIQEARSYLVGIHGGHEASREAIEAAYDKIIAAKFTQRKKTKMNLKTALQKRKDEAPSWVQDLFDRVEVPKRNTILQRLLLFVLIGAWSISAPAEGGPAFQVACALGASIYFLNDRLKSVGRAAIIGLGALVVGWIAGSLLVPAFLAGAVAGGSALELATALISYFFLFVATTFLK